MFEHDCKKYKCRPCSRMVYALLLIGMDARVEYRRERAALLKAFWKRKEN